MWPTSTWIWAHVWKDSHDKTLLSSFISKPKLDAGLCCSFGWKSGKAWQLGRCVYLLPQVKLGWCEPKWGVHKLLRTNLSPLSPQLSLPQEQGCREQEVGGGCTLYCIWLEWLPNPSGAPTGSQGSYIHPELSGEMGWFLWWRRKWKLGGWTPEDSTPLKEKVS